MKKQFLVCMSLAIISTSVVARELPTIAVLNLIYNKVEQTPVTTTTVNSSSSTNATPSTTSTTTVIQQEVQKELSMFSADTRGALINSQQFKVIDLPRANALWQGNTNTVLSYLNSLNPTPVSNAQQSTALALPTESATRAKASNESAISTNTTSESQMTLGGATINIDKTLPDYVLVGTIAAVTQDEDREPLQDTNKSTAQYNIDISVDYQIISTKDKAVIASFNAYGHASDVKILNDDSTRLQKQNHNIPLLINQASKDLADNVVTQLKQQFGVSIKTYNLESITNLKIYND